MTRLEIFTIYDSKAQAYLQPFFSLNAETAQREFTKAVNGEGNFSQFAEDYSLHLLGLFDQEEGTFTIETAPVHICNAITLKHRPEFPRDIRQLEMDNFETKETAGND